MKGFLIFSAWYLTCSDCEGNTHKLSGWLFKWFPSMWCTTSLFVSGRPSFSAATILWVCTPNVFLYALPSPLPRLASRSFALTSGVMRSGFISKFINRNLSRFPILAQVIPQNTSFNIALGARVTSLPHISHGLVNKLERHFWLQ